MRREDWSLQKVLAKKESKWYKEVYLKLPFIKVQPEIYKLVQDDIKNREDLLTFSVQDMLNHMPFYEYIWYMKSDPIQLAFAIKLLPNDDVLQKPWQDVPIGSILMSSVGNSLSALSIECRDGKWYWENLRKPTPYDGEVFNQEHPRIHASMLYLMITQLMDLYPVSVKSKRDTSTLHSKKPWTRTDQESVLFLNSMPKEKGESLGGTHASPRGHQRRGHSRKITHPRFKNHPKFGSKIRVKPAWVGPTETTLLGQTYKLIQKDDNELLSNCLL